jgi:hypothetical protein
LVAKYSWNSVMKIFKKQKQIVILLSLIFCNLNYSQKFVYPTDSGVLNIRSAPFNAIGDGVADDTQAIKNALIAATIDYRYINMTIYIPNGTYLISEQIYWPQNGNGVPMFVQIQGESELGTIIKLKDNCSGFVDASNPREMIVTGCCSENAFRNSIRNLTLNSGNDNPGASGLNYFASNAGICEYVSIISGDGQGKTGLILPANTGPAMISNVTIKGFDIGIYSQWGNLTTLENITLENQNVYGFQSAGGRNAIRKLSSINNVIAVYCTGSEGQTTLIDSNLQGTNATIPAIYCEQPTYIRNTQTLGYQKSISLNNGGCTDDVAIGMINEWNFNCNYNTLFDIGDKNFSLPIQETPPSNWEQDLSKWANVITFGADPTGQRDCTSAIQAAIDSGANTIYFPTGIDHRYFMTGTVEVRGNVERIIGCEARIPYSPNGKFKIIDSPNSPKTVFFERFQGSSDDKQPSIEQASSNRRLVIKSISDWKVLGNGMGDIIIQDMAGLLYPNTKGANIWARQLNNENFTINNNGSKLWILGMKVESGDFTWINTSQGGTTELLGFLDYHSGSSSLTVPQFINNESTVQILPASFLTFGSNTYEVSVRETQSGVTRDLTGVGWSGYYYKGKNASNLKMKSNEELSQNLRLYPNPTAQNVTLEYNLLENGLVNVGLFDTLGKKILQIKDENQNSGEQKLNIDTQNLNSGIYFVKLNYNGSQITKKLIISKYF